MSGGEIYMIRKRPMSCSDIEKALGKKKNKKKKKKTKKWNPLNYLDKF